MNPITKWWRTRKLERFGAECEAMYEFERSRILLHNTLYQEISNFIFKNLSYSIFTTLNTDTITITWRWKGEIVHRMHVDSSANLRSRPTFMDPFFSRFNYNGFTERFFEYAEEEFEKYKKQKLLDKLVEKYGHK